MGGHQSRKILARKTFSENEKQHVGEGHQDSFVMILVVYYRRC